MLRPWVLLFPWANLSLQNGLLLLEQLVSRSWLVFDFLGLLLQTSVGTADYPLLVGAPCAIRLLFRFVCYYEGIALAWLRFLDVLLPEMG